MKKIAYSILSLITIATISTSAFATEEEKKCYMVNSGTKEIRHCNPHVN